MAWGCGSLVASTAPLPCLPTQQRQSTHPPHRAAPPRPSRSTAPAAAADRTSPPPPPSLAPSPLRRGFLNGCSARGGRLLRRAAEYVFPDPIPEFAEAETDKFRRHMMERLSKKDVFGSSVEEVVGICTGAKNEAVGLASIRKLCCTILHELHPMHRS